VVKIASAMVVRAQTAERLLFTRVKIFDSCSGAA